MKEVETKAVSPRWQRCAAGQSSPEEEQPAALPPAHAQPRSRRDVTARRTALAGDPAAGRADAAHFRWHSRVGESKQAVLCVTK